MVSPVSENSMPATRLSATLKLMNLTSPTLSTIAPLSPFFHPTKLVKLAVMSGFKWKLSVELNGSKTMSEQGYVLGINPWNKRRPYLPFE
jgi:hypothetical protein